LTHNCLFCIFNPPPNEFLSNKSNGEIELPINWGEFYSYCQKVYRSPEKRKGHCIPGPATLRALYRWVTIMTVDTLVYETQVTSIDR